MKYRNIAIEREYGSGGTQIGEAVAKELGIACCGREIYEKVASDLRITVSEAENMEENMTNSFLYSLAMLANAQRGNGTTLSMEQKIHLSMQKEMCEVAEQERCVFIGHCAIEALKNRNDVLRVFIRAGDSSKTNRIVNEYNVLPDMVERTKEKVNRRRRKTFQAYTSKQWENPDSYDLILDSGKLGIENCVSVLVGLLK